MPRTAPARSNPAGTARFLGPEAAVALQRTAGNRVVSRLLDEDQYAHETGDGHGAAMRYSGVNEVLRMSGQPLDESLRSDMEGRFGGADFSDVRLHTGLHAQRSAAEIGARAYTSGDHIVIGEGGADLHTLAHELTHVVQQRQGPVAGTDNGSGLRLSDPSDSFEQAAEANAVRVMTYEPPALEHDTDD